MTIESVYTPVVLNISPDGIYFFQFQFIDETDLAVFGRDVNDVDTPISSGLYTVTPSGSPPIFDSGSIALAAANLPVGTVSVVITRSTTIEQKVDYLPYSPFPAETTEFAFDKLTLIAQEQVAGTSAIGGGGGDTGDAVPLAGTVLNAPMTGNIESKAFGADWRAGIIGGGFNDYYIVDLVQDGTHVFGVSVNLKQTIFDSTGQVLLATVFDGSEDPTTAASVQYVLDAVGAPTGSFIPLSGTTVGNDVTGPILFDNATLVVDASFGILEGLTDLMTLYSDHSILIASGPTPSSQWWAFGVDGTLTMPDINYTAAADLSAVTKGYVDAAVAGGGPVDVFVPLAGTDVGAPITGNIQFENATNNRSFFLGTDVLPGFEDGIVLAQDGSSGAPSTFFVSMGGSVYSFTPTLFTAPEISTSNLNASAIVTDGIIGGGALFDGDVTITSPAELTAAGVLCTSLVSAGHINTGNVSSDTYTVTDTTPNSSNNLTSKSYVDGQVNTKVSLSGDTMTGSLAISSASIPLIVTNMPNSAVGNLVRWQVGGSFPGLLVQDASVQLFEVSGVGSLLEEFATIMGATPTQMTNLQAALTSRGL